MCAGCRVSSAVCALLFVVCFALCDAHCFLLVVVLCSWLLFVSSCSLLVLGCWMCGCRCLLFVACCVMLAVCSVVLVE